MPWDGTKQSNAGTTFTTTEIYRGTSDVAGTFTDAFAHEPGEITDLIAIFDISVAAPDVVIRMSTYNSLDASPANRAAYSIEPVSRVDYFPNTAGAPGIARFPMPIGRLYRMIFGFVTIGIPGGGSIYSVSMEWRQDGVNLSP